ncbi:bifunctional protein TrpGD [Striga asiatica]|uniref:Bifunctional protein TrpGD n=1 Tax=Striga asiatica TaxID=4170 RepID=A0A5A7PWH2_STRAF|nr:bifunctional protein TrpGD [Striga asiatica]
MHNRRVIGSLTDVVERLLPDEARHRAHDEPDVQWRTHRGPAGACAPVNETHLKARAALIDFCCEREAAVEAVGGSDGIAEHFCDGHEEGEESALERVSTLMFLGDDQIKMTSLMEIHSLKSCGQIEAFV